MEVLVPVSITLLVVVIIFAARREFVRDAHKHVYRKKAEQLSWAQENFISENEVADVQKELQLEIEERFNNVEKKKLLREIIDEWAELRILAFREKRSWVRKPEVEVEVSHKPEK